MSLLNKLAKKYEVSAGPVVDIRTGKKLSPSKISQLKKSSPLKKEELFWVKCPKCRQDLTEDSSVSRTYHIRYGEALTWGHYDGKKGDFTADDGDPTFDRYGGGYGHYDYTDKCANCEVEL